MPVAAGSPWLLPFFVCDPWSPWPFLGLVLGPLYCVRSWSGSCGVDYFFAHLAFLVPQLPRHFHFLPALLLVGQCKEALLQAAGSFVCLAGSTETWGGGGKGWKVCGCQPFRRRLTWMMARLLISVHKWHCVLHGRASLSERSGTWEFNSLQLSCETNGFLLSPPGSAAGQRINTSLSDAHGCFKGCFSLSVSPPSQNGRPLDNISVVAHKGWYVLCFFLPHPLSVPPVKLLKDECQLFSPFGSPHAHSKETHPSKPLVIMKEWQFGGVGRIWLPSS